MYEIRYNRRKHGIEIHRLPEYRDAIPSREITRALDAAGFRLTAKRRNRDGLHFWYRRDTDDARDAARAIIARARAMADTPTDTPAPSQADPPAPPPEYPVPAQPPAGKG